MINIPFKKLIDAEESNPPSRAVDSKKIESTLNNFNFSIHRIEILLIDPDPDSDILEENILNILEKLNLTNYPRINEIFRNPDHFKSPWLNCFTVSSGNNTFSLKETSLENIFPINLSHVYIDNHSHIPDKGNADFFIFNKIAQTIIEDLESFTLETHVATSMIYDLLWELCDECSIPRLKFV